MPFNLASVARSVGKKSQGSQEAVIKAKEYVDIATVAEHGIIFTGHDAASPPKKKRKTMAQRKGKGSAGGPSRALDEIIENPLAESQESELPLPSIQQMLRTNCGQDWSDFRPSTAEYLRRNLVSHSDRSKLFAYQDAKDMIDIAIGRILSSFTALDLAVEYHNKVITQTELLVQAERDATNDRIREVTRVMDEKIAKLTSEIGALKIKLKKVEDENDNLKQESTALKAQVQTQEAVVVEAKKERDEARRAHEVEIKDMEEELSAYLSVQKEGMAKYLALRCPKLPADFFDEYDILDDMLKKKAEIDQRRQAERG